MRRTGDLADTVVEVDMKKGKGTGFTFVDYHPYAQGHREGPAVLCEQGTLGEAYETGHDPGLFLGEIGKRIPQALPGIKEGRMIQLSSFRTNVLFVPSGRALIFSACDMKKAERRLYEEK